MRDVYSHEEMRQILGPRTFYGPEKPPVVATEKPIPTWAKLDVDRKFRRQSWLEWCNVVAGKLVSADLRPVVAIVHDTRKGHHIRLGFVEDIGEHLTLALQAILGSDPWREAHNLRRIRGGHTHWNFLAYEKVKWSGRRTTYRSTEKQNNRYGVLLMRLVKEKFDRREENTRNLVESGFLSTTSGAPKTKVGTATLSLFRGGKSRAPRKTRKGPRRRNPETRNGVAAKKSVETLGIGADERIEGGIAPLTSRKQGIPARRVVDPSARSRRDAT